MKFTRKFLEDNILALQPEVLKAVIQLLYEREWIVSGNKLTRKAIAKRFGLSEHYCQITSEIIRNYFKTEQVKSRSSRQLAAKAGGQTSIKSSIIPATTFNGKLFSAEFPMAQDPDSSAQKVQQVLGEGKTFSEGWKVEMSLCHEWHKAKSGKISNPTLAMMNWASNAKKYGDINILSQPKPELIIDPDQEDLSVGWK